MLELNHADNTKVKHHHFNLLLLSPERWVGRQLDASNSISNRTLVIIAYENPPPDKPATDLGENPGTPKTSVPYPDGSLFRDDDDFDTHPQAGPSNNTPIPSSRFGNFSYIPSQKGKGKARAATTKATTKSRHSTSRRVTIDDLRDVTRTANAQAEDHVPDKPPKWQANIATVEYLSNMVDRLEKKTGEHSTGIAQLAESGQETIDAHNTLIDQIDSLETHHQNTVASHLDLSAKVDTLVIAVNDIKASMESMNRFLKSSDVTTQPRGDATDQPSSAHRQPRNPLSSATGF
ncbi:protein STU2 [Microdochium nivale]|nr:protein STU2 [Microdochium nivale]